MARQDPITEELERIQRTNGGVLRPHDVVEFATDPETALHGCFTWDDTKAAQEHRLWQARQVIRVKVKVVAPDTEPVRAFVSLTPDRELPGGGYRSTVDVLSDDERRQQMLADALAELNRVKAKYKHLKELAAVFAEVEKVSATRRQRKRA